MKQKNKTTIGLCIIVILLILLIAGTYAMFHLRLEGKKTQILRAKTLSLVLDDNETDGILLEKAIPVSDRKGSTYDPYTFSLQNNGEVAMSYTLYLEDKPLSETETRMNDKYVKYSLEKNNNEPVVALLTTIGTTPNRVLDKGIIDKQTTNTYNLRMWIDQAATNDVIGTIFYGRLRLEVTNETTNEEQKQD